LQFIGGIGKYQSRWGIVMTEVITCPGCLRKLQLPLEIIGQVVQCPACQKTFTAENPAPPPPVRAPSLEPYRPPPERAEPPRPRGYGEGDEVVRRPMAPHRGGALLTIGILGLVLCPPVLGPMAWVMANSDLVQMQAGRMDDGGESMTRAGQVLGIIATIVGVLMVLFFCLGVMADTGGRRW
jgi:hypothetical protein